MSSPWSSDCEDEGMLILQDGDNIVDVGEPDESTNSPVRDKSPVVTKHRSRNTNPFKYKREQRSVVKPLVVPDIGTNFARSIEYTFNQCEDEQAVCKLAGLPPLEYPAAVCAAVLGPGCINFTFATMQEPRECMSFKIPRANNNNFINNVMVANYTNFMCMDDKIKAFLKKIKGYTVYTICKQLSNRCIKDLFAEHDIKIVPRPWSAFRYCVSCMVWSCQSLQLSSAHGFVGCSKCLLAAFLRTYANGKTYKLYGW